MVVALMDECGQVAELLAAELIVVVAIEPLEQPFQPPRSVTPWSWWATTWTTRPTTRTRPVRTVPSIAARGRRTIRSATAWRGAIRAATSSLLHLRAALAHFFTHRLPLGIIELPVAVLVKFLQHALPKFRVLHPGTALRSPLRLDLLRRRFVLGCGNTHGARYQQAHHDAQP
jgi:hypothetical protein